MRESNRRRIHHIHHIHGWRGTGEAGEAVENETLRCQCQNRSL